MGRAYALRRRRAAVVNGVLPRKAKFRDHTEPHRHAEYGLDDEYLLLHARRARLRAVEDYTS